MSELRIEWREGVGVYGWDAFDKSKRIRPRSVAIRKNGWLQVWYEDGQCVNYPPSSVSYVIGATYSAQ